MLVSVHGAMIKHRTLSDSSFDGVETKTEDSERCSANRGVIWAGAGLSLGEASVQRSQKFGEAAASLGLG